MKQTSAILGLAVLLIANSAASQSPPVVGERYEILVSYETRQRGSSGSSSNSSGRDELQERVIAVSDAGLELEFDLPANATTEDRARVWQYPARVLRPTTGRMRLLNGKELEARLDLWLAAAGMTRDMCGRWIFTWNAFRIECDPQSVIADIEAIDLGGLRLREGAVYRHPEGVGTGVLARSGEAAGGYTYAVELQVDANAVRDDRAKEDVAIGEMMKQPVTLESALETRSKDTISGTIKVSFDVDAAGNATRRTAITNLVTERPGGVSETDQKTVTVVRRRIP